MMKRIIFFSLLATVLFGSCTDEVQYSTDVNDALTFSVDTLKMDTVFAGVPSATYSCMVYNRTKSDLNLSDITFREGDKGFRVNVDGAYLDGTLHNLEIRQGDSIRIFAELTPTVNGEAPVDPEELKEALRFRLSSGREQELPLHAYRWQAEEKDWWEVNDDTDLEPQRPIIIRSGLRVSAGVTLSLRHARLFFHDGAGCDIAGTLRATDCLFRGDRLDHLFSYLPYDRVSGQWKGLVFREHSKGNVLDGCEIRNGMDGIVCQDSVELTMTGTRVHNSKGHALAATASEITLDHCQLTNAQGCLLLMKGGAGRLTSCTLAQFYPFDADRGAACASDEATLTVSRSLLTGYAKDVVDCKGGDVRFTQCLIRKPETPDVMFDQTIWETPETEDGGISHFVNIDEDNLYYDFTIQEKSVAWKNGIGDLETDAQ